MVYQGRIQVWSESAPTPFCQINHANAAYFRLFLVYFQVISATRPPPFGSCPPPFYISWIRPCLWTYNILPGLINYVYVKYWYSSFAFIIIVDRDAKFPGILKAVNFSQEDWEFQGNIGNFGKCLETLGILK